jgi:hypothetical protein
MIFLELYEIQTCSKYLTVGVLANLIYNAFVTADQLVIRNYSVHCYFNPFKCLLILSSCKHNLS